MRTIDAKRLANIDKNGIEGGKRLANIENILDQQNELIRYSTKHTDLFNKLMTSAIKNQITTPESDTANGTATTRENASKSGTDGSKESSPVPVQRANRESSKFKREPTVASVIRDVSKAFTDATVNATSSAINQLGNEIVPYFNETKNAVNSVAGGILEASKITKSFFTREPVAKEKKVVDSSRDIINTQKDTTNTISRIERVKESHNRIDNIKQRHNEHKLISKVDDILDMMRLNMLLNFKDLLPSVSAIGALFAGGGAITGLLAGLDTFKINISSVFDTILDSFKSIITKVRSLFTIMGDKLKSMFDKLPDFMKPDSMRTVDIDKTNDIDRVRTTDTDIDKPNTNTNAAKRTPNAANNVPDSLNPDFKPDIERPSTFRAVANTVDAVDGKLEKTIIEKLLFNIGKRLGAIAFGPVGAVVGIALTAYDVADMALDGLDLTIEDVVSDPKSIGKAIEQKTEFRAISNIQRGMPSDATAAESAKMSVEIAEKQKIESDRYRQAMINSTSNNSTVINNNYSTLFNRSFAHQQNADYLNQRNPHGIQQQ